MIQHTKLEQTLDALGGAIAAEGSVVEQVTERIDRLPHRPLKEVGAARRWMGRAALIIVGGLVGLAAGWYVPHESADAAAPLDRTGEPFTRAHAPSGDKGKALVTQRDHHFALISKPPEASLGSTVGVSAYFRQMGGATSTSSLARWNAGGPSRAVAPGVPNRPQASRIRRTRGISRRLGPR